MHLAGGGGPKTLCVLDALHLSPVSVSFPLCRMMDRWQTPTVLGPDENGTDRTSSQQGPEERLLPPYRTKGLKRKKTNSSCVLYLPGWKSHCLARTPSLCHACLSVAPSAATVKSSSLEITALGGVSLCLYPYCSASMPVILSPLSSPITASCPPLNQQSVGVSVELEISTTLTLLLLTLNLLTLRCQKDQTQSELIFKTNRASQMTQQAQVLAFKPSDLNLILRIHTVERTDSLSTCTLLYTHPHM